MLEMGNLKLREGTAYDAKRRYALKTGARDISDPFLGKGAVRATRTCRRDSVKLKFLGTGHRLL